MITNSSYKEKFYINSDEQLKPFDALSVKKICGDAKQVMVYGWEHCLYAHVENGLSNSDLFNKVFDYRVGKKKRITLEGNVIKRISML
jgi:hypothetical protein